LSKGGATHRVPVGLFALNRRRLVAYLRDETPAGDWARVTPGLTCVLRGGEGATRDDTDAERVFRQESFFWWATGCEEPGCWFTLEVATGAGTLWVPRTPPEYVVWVGSIRGPEHYKAKYGVEDVRYVDELPEQMYPCLVLAGVNEDSGAAHAGVGTSGAGPPSGDNGAREGAAGLGLGGEWPGFQRFVPHPRSTVGASRLYRGASVLYEAMVELRAVKSSMELEVLAYANRVSSRAHCKVMRELNAPALRLGARAVRSGGRMMEYELEAVFRFACHASGGCAFTAYPCICASGPNPAHLHYPHNDREFGAGDMCLLDMGGEYLGYASDITCSFPADGVFTPEQRSIYEAVLEARDAVLAAMRPGEDWRKLHLLAEHVLGRNLLRLGILRGDTVEGLVERRVVALFQPHGLGHLMGLDVHDCGGWPVLDPRTDGALDREAWHQGRLGLKSLRCGRTLTPNMVITVEPGCYFNAAFLKQALDDPKMAPYLDAETLARYLPVGGVRIEDDVVITDDGVINLTDVPRTVDEIEAHMRGEGPWIPTMNDVG